MLNFSKKHGQKKVLNSYNICVCWAVTLELPKVQLLSHIFNENWSIFHLVYEIFQRNYYVSNPTFISVQFWRLRYQQFLMMILLILLMIFKCHSWSFSYFVARHATFIYEGKYKKMISCKMYSTFLRCMSKLCTNTRTARLRLNI